MPGTVEIVRELHAAGVPMFGLTNWPDEFWPHAPAKFEFLGLLDDVVVSGTERVAKPDPAIFEIAVARAGLPPTDLVFVDDKQSTSLRVDRRRTYRRAGVRERGLPVCHGGAERGLRAWRLRGAAAGWPVLSARAAAAAAA